ncbi:uncharacterized protein LOC121674730 isoform X2 [Corvus kubaryi]|nr:uncharacterized protein LOC121674730 isoform X2 [Corvus kubaryi]
MWQNLCPPEQEASSKMSYEGGYTHKNETILNTFPLIMELTKRSLKLMALLLWTSTSFGSDESCTVSTPEISVPVTFVAITPPITCLRVHCGCLSCVAAASPTPTSRPGPRVAAAPRSPTGAAPARVWALRGPALPSLLALWPVSGSALQTPRCFECGPVPARCCAAQLLVSLWKPLLLPPQGSSSRVLRAACHTDARFLAARGPRHPRRLRHCSLTRCRVAGDPETGMGSAIRHGLPRGPGASSTGTSAGTAAVMCSWDGGRVVSATG